MSDHTLTSNTQNTTSPEEFFSTHKKAGTFRPFNTKEQSSSSNGLTHVLRDSKAQMAPKKVDGILRDPEKQKLEKQQLEIGRLAFQEGFSLTDQDGVRRITLPPTIIEEVQAGIKKDITALYEQKIKDLEGGISAAEQESSLLKEKLEALTAENERLAEDSKNLTSQLTALQEEIASLKINNPKQEVITPVVTDSPSPVSKGVLRSARKSLVSFAQKALHRPSDIVIPSQENHEDIQLNQTTETEPQEAPSGGRPTSTLRPKSILSGKPFIKKNHGDTSSPETSQGDVEHKKYNPDIVTDFIINVINNEQKIAELKNVLKNLLGTLPNEEDREDQKKIHIYLQTLDSNTKVIQGIIDELRKLIARPGIDQGQLKENMEALKFALSLVDDQKNQYSINSVKSRYAHIQIQEESEPTPVTETDKLIASVTGKEEHRERQATEEELVKEVDPNQHHKATESATEKREEELVEQVVVQNAEPFPETPASNPEKPKATKEKINAVVHSLLGTLDKLLREARRTPKGNWKDLSGPILGASA